MSQGPLLFGVILPAAGSGTRFGGGDKLLMDLAGQSVLQRSVSLFAGRPDVREFIIVTAPERFDAYRQHLADIRREIHFVPGGRERWESVMSGLHALAGLPDPPEFVAVHDAARPLCPEAVIDGAFAAARDMGGALPCVAEPATLKRQSDIGCVQETVDRRGLFQAQTPQCFRLAALLAGYNALANEGRAADLTDDAQVFERLGRPVKITAGSPLNLKITTAEDLQLARAIIAAGGG